MSTKTLITVEQFGQMHFSDTEDYELLDGDLILLSRGTYRHSKIRSRLERLINSYLEEHRIGEVFSEVDCRVADARIRRPDLSIHLTERLRQIDLDKIPAPFAPDIAIEVLSPSEGMMETRGKVREYLSAGSVEVWLLDHANREMQVHSHGGIRVLQGNDVLATPVLPGFSVTVADLGMNL